ncbi:MAG: two-component sensor histidine kinase [Gammaproteobacteria bacterium]|nr:two-component sensor histidine kinase [Gammaproteobacteria bacterium]MCW5582981.1 two-component sensor histidine kinase [Gammaproteobacteria bacterium]
MMTKHNNINFDKLPEEVKNYIHHLEQVRSDFVANVSHELRTPLTVISGYLETLLKNNHPEKEMLNKIFMQMYQHSLRMADIIEDLLLLAHLESEDHPIDEKSDIFVKNILQALCVDAKNISGDKKHKIRLHADKRLLIRGSESELRSLFSNLIVNAIKYTPRGGNIDIKWSQDQQGHGCFSVIDTGIGIASEHLPRITERFYQVDTARSWERGGTGLGLAIVKHVLLRHDATLQIESEVDKGSKFTCIFPAFRMTFR